VKSLRFTLLTDGSSDRTLLPVLTWLLQQNGVTDDVRGQWAELRFLRPRSTVLHQRVCHALDLYPCDLLFIHRDAEGQGREARVREITEALATISRERQLDVPAVFVIPVRMQEAWLLIDAHAIRRAAGNPAGDAPLDVPGVNRIEALPDPKATLLGLLRTASGLTGRRLRRLSLPALRYRVAELIVDFGPLRGLAAFAALERDLAHILAQNHWAG
jgi:hypothetical protein